MRELRRQGLQLHSSVTSWRWHNWVVGEVLALVIALLSLSDVLVADEITKTIASRPTSFSIFGTWNTLSTITTLARQYESERQTHCINFTPIDSDQILERLSRHECDVGMPFISFVLEKSKDFAKQIKCVKVATFVVGVAVNAKAPTRVVTLGELRKIFAAYPNDPKPITSWKDIGDSGNDAQIEFYRPPASSAVAWFFRQRVLQGCVFTDQWIAPNIRPPCEKPTDAQVIGAVAQQSNAIGFFLMGNEKNLDKRVRILRIAKDKNSRLPDAARLGPCSSNGCTRLTR